MKNRLIILLAVAVIGVIANPVSKQTISSDNKNPAQAESIESQTKHEESTLNNGEQKKGETIEIKSDESSESKDANCDDKVEIIIEESVVGQVDDTANMIEDAPSSDILPPEQIPSELQPVESNPIDLLSSAQGPIDFLPPQENPLELQPVEPNPIDLLSSAQVPIDFLPPPESPLDLLPQAAIPEGFEDDFPVNDVPFRDAPINTIQDEIMQTAAGFAPTPLIFRRKNKPRRRFANRRHFRPNPFRRKFHFFYPYYGFYHPSYPSSLRFY